MSNIAADRADVSTVGAAKDEEGYFLKKVILIIIGAAIGMFVLSIVASISILYWLQHTQVRSSYAAIVAIPAIIIIPGIILGLWFRRSSHVLKVILATVGIVVGIVLLSFVAFVLIVISPAIVITAMSAIVVVLGVILGFYLARRYDKARKKITHAVSLAVSLLFASLLTFSGFFYFFMILSKGIGD